MLLVDRITSIEADRACSALKNISYNDWFFPEHFKGYPVMPGSLQIECFTQVVALPLLVAKSVILSDRFPLLLAGVDKARFYSPVRPGDQLEIVAEIRRNALGVVLALAEGFVSGNKVSECQVTYRII